MTVCVSSVCLGSAGGTCSTSFFSVFKGAALRGRYCYRSALPSPSCLYGLFAAVLLGAVRPSSASATAVKTGFPCIRRWFLRRLCVPLCCPLLHVVLSSQLHIAQPFLSVASDIQPLCSFHFLTPFPGSFLPYRESIGFPPPPPPQNYIFSSAFSFILSPALTTCSSVIS